MQANVALFEQGIVIEMKAFAPSLHQKILAALLLEIQLLELNSNHRGLLVDLGLSEHDQGDTPLADGGHILSDLAEMLAPQHCLGVQGHVTRSPLQLAVVSVRTIFPLSKRELLAIWLLYIYLVRRSCQ